MDDLKKILVFRTDRLGDFIISKSVLNTLFQTKQFLIDIVVSKQNYDYVKNFKSFNNIYIFKKNFLKFFLLNKDLLFKKYDYILIHDGKRRSHFLSLFVRGKKFSLIKFSKSSIFYKFIKIFNFTTYYNSENTKLYDNLHFLNLLINVNKNISTNNFYFDYEFDESFSLNKKYCIFHLDEKWFKNYYYNDFTYPEWSIPLFNQIINIIKNKFNLPILITTGNIKIKFLENLINSQFTKSSKNIYMHNELKDNLLFINNLSFRQIEFVLKKNCSILISCEGGLTHLSNNLNIKTFAFVQKNRVNFYKHWTGHMRNIKLCERSDSSTLLNILSNL